MPTLKLASPLLVLTAAIFHHFQSCTSIKIVCLVLAVLVFAAARLSSSCSDQGLLSLQSAQASHGSSCSRCLWSGVSGAQAQQLLSLPVEGLLSLQSAQASRRSSLSRCLWRGVSGAWTRLLLGAWIRGRTRVSRIGRRSLHHGPTKGARCS